METINSEIKKLKFDITKNMECILSKRIVLNEAFSNLIHYLNTVEGKNMIINFCKKSEMSNKKTDTPVTITSDIILRSKENKLSEEEKHAIGMSRIHNVCGDVYKSKDMHSDGESMIDKLKPIYKLTGEIDKKLLSEVMYTEKDINNMHIELKLSNDVDNLSKRGEDFTYEELCQKLEALRYHTIHYIVHLGEKSYMLNFPSILWLFYDFHTLKLNIALVDNEYIKKFDGINSEYDKQLKNINSLAYELSRKIELKKNVEDVVSEMHKNKIKNINTDK